MRMKAYALQLAIFAGIAAGHWQQLEMAENLALAVIWGTILLSIPAAFIPNETFFKNNKRRPWIRALFFTNVVLIIATGRFFTGAMMLIAWTLLWAKRVSWEAEIKNKSASL